MVAERRPVTKPTGSDFAGSRRLIFGVGAHRTGTSSLTEALTILGFRASHWGDRAEIRRDLDQGIFRLSLMKRMDAVSDLPIPTIWRNLASTFPDARFILTIRAPEEWIESVEWHTRDRQLVQEEQEFYNRSTFDRDSFLAAYTAHNSAVIEYFSGRDNFLTLNISAGDGWEKLCPFLEVNLPSEDISFPRAGSSKGS
ncbi:sulfotransferase family protein [Streptomyces sp. NPDC004237]|uniref:sulfotransferase family protein n=1 Tax=Streptomyces sp. NPDC004237 TaxID=3154455 RepID=UPI0033BDCD2A